MIFFYIIGLAWSGMATFTFAVALPIRTWKARPVGVTSLLLLISAALDLVFLDALNWIPGVF